MPNRLAESQSPYLLLHSHQNIDWWPWCEQAWQEAKRRNVPVFVSLGYSACHWCHVMSEESFDDPTIAQALNSSFVAIKVDRQEHPDVDAVFMQATQALTQSGGWPNSVFCTPDGQPFFAGTYFPPTRVNNVPSFGELLQALSNAWQLRQDEVTTSAATIATQLQDLANIPTVEKDQSLFDIRKQVAGKFDPIHGGFGSAPKFPPAMTIDALLVSGDAGELEMAKHTLEAMARGGIHDQLGGGFHRYSVDAGWVVPHFEKMLYDNALLLGSYTRGWRRTPDHDGYVRALFAAAAHGIVGWAEREMLTESGGFAASLDADSSDIRGMAHEGIYYCWNPELLVDALGEEDADFASATFHVTATGSFDNGLSTLQLRGHPDAERLAKVRNLLFAQRSQRFRPARDDVIVAAWNGLMLDSLVQAAMVFAEPHCLKLASNLSECLWGMWDGESLWRTLHCGVRTAPGSCEDYAAVALGFARFAAATGQQSWLQRAVQLLETAQDKFGAADGGWFDAAANELLFARARDVTDASVPSATSIMVAGLELVGLLAERSDFVELARRGAATQRGVISSYPLAAGWALEQAMINDESRRGLGRATIVVVTPDGDPMHPLSCAVWRMAPAGSAIITLADDQQWGSLHEGRVSNSTGTVYICRGTTCFAPVSTIEELKVPLWSRCGQTTPQPPAPGCDHHRS